MQTRRANLMRDEYEKQIETLKLQHELSMKRLNNELEKLYGEKHDLQKELETKTLGASVKATTSGQAHRQHRNQVQSNSDQHIAMMMMGNNHRTSVNRSNTSSASNGSTGIGK